MIRNGIITIEYQPGYHYINSLKSLWQYDYGQTLRLKGFDLPLVSEIHFSDVETGGTTTTEVGTTQDDITDVHIPDKLLKLSKRQDYNIYAFVYMTDDESGNTECKIRIPVRSRPNPGIETGEGEKTPFADAINAVNSAADRAETAERAAGQSALAAETARELAERAEAGATEAKNRVDETMENFIQESSAAIKNANAARDEAEAWAHGSALYPEKDTDNAKHYAEMAKQVAVNNGFCRMHVDESGHLILERTKNIVDSLNFKLNEKGHLEVEMR